MEKLKHNINDLRIEIEFFDFAKTKKEQKAILKKMLDLIVDIDYTVHKLKHF